MHARRAVAHLIPEGLPARGTALVALIAWLGAGPAAVTGQDSADLGALRDYVAAYRATWDTHDATALSGFFSRDADFVMGNLPLVRGRAAIGDWWRTYFDQQEPERRIQIDVTSARLLTSSVALLNVTTTTGGRDRDGQLLLARRARGTWVLRRHDTVWTITAMRGLPTEEDRVELGPFPGPPDSARSQIRTFLNAYEIAFNSHDPDAVSAFFRDDADLIVREGPVVAGSQAIRSWWEAYFRLPRPYHALFLIEDISMQSDDVALLNVLATGTPLQPSATSAPARQARGTWVLMRAEAGWQIAALRVLPDETDRIDRAIQR